MRVIAGALRGRRLIAPSGRGTRPTSDRVRESLFMMLEPWEGRRIVDLYAGSGAMGIEALSRGAARVDFVEASSDALEALEANLQALGLGSRAQAWQLTLPAAIARIRPALAEADVVLMDPPYGGGPAREMLEALGGPGVLRAGCRIVLEHHAKDDVSAPRRLMKAGGRAYGETHITLFEARDDAPHGTEEPRR